MKQTNLDAIKLTAKALLRLPIAETAFSPAIVIHPVYESAFQMVGEKKEIVNILEDEEALNTLNAFFDKRIDQADSVNKLLFIIRTPYWLLFLKYSKDYLSKKDFSSLLGDIWTESENPNADVNVSIRTSASYFKQADKKVLMHEDEYLVYQSLPDELTVYRGVAPGRVKDGLSWTANRDKALWFAGRFNSDGKNQGYILSGIVKKKNVLAYLNRRGEDELVVYPKDVMNVKKTVLS